MEATRGATVGAWVGGSIRGGDRAPACVKASDGGCEGKGQAKVLAEVGGIVRGADLGRKARRSFLDIQVLKK